MLTFYKNFYIILIFCFLIFSCLPEREFNEKRELPEFTGIKCSNSVNVILNRGEFEKIAVRVIRGRAEDLITEVNDGILNIYFDNASLFPMTGRKAELEITMPDLQSIEASGTSEVKGNTIFTVENIDLHSSGAARIVIELDASNIFAQCSGGADISLIGKSKNIEIRASGGSDVSASRLTTTYAKVETSGGADVFLHVTDELSATASGGSDIRYIGNPYRLDVNSSGGADIKKVSE